MDHLDRPWANQWIAIGLVQAGISIGSLPSDGQKAAIFAAIAITLFGVALIRGVR